MVVLTGHFGVPLLRLRVFRAEDSGLRLTAQTAGQSLSTLHPMVPLK